MKKVILLLAMLILSYAGANAQKFKTIKKGFDVESGTDAKTSIIIEGKEFPIFLTKKNVGYIKCKSIKTGRYYPVWIGTITGETHEGRDVYQMKSGKYCIYKISEKTGNPYSVWLEENKKK